jgi:hypothetical protein
MQHLALGASPSLQMHQGKVLHLGNTALCCRMATDKNYSVKVAEKQKLTVDRNHDLTE